MSEGQVTEGERREAAAESNCADLRALAKKIVSIGGTQSKLGRVYLSELATMVGATLPNGKAGSDE